MICIECAKQLKVNPIYIGINYCVICKQMVSNEESFESVSEDNVEILQKET